MTPTEQKLFDALVKAYEAFDGEEDSVKEEHEDLIQEIEAVINEINGTTAVDPPVRAFTFDVELYATIEVKAINKSAAKNLLLDRVHQSEANFGAWPNGDPILGNIGLPDEAITLVMIDGEPVD